jgi:two-component system alkaline phosphatase synthesis response regulator PhoP
MVVSPTAVSRPERYRDLHLNMDFASASAELDSCPMVLTRKEYALLSLLVRNAGEIIPRDVFLWIIWGYGPQIRTRTLDVHIRRLRKKFGIYGETYIETIFGIGYRFQPLRQERSLPDHFTVAAVA